MLAIRMQRTGRKGHAQFRVVVQDSRQTPSSGRVIALLGNYNPHTKEAKLDKEKASFYLKNGAQPSDRVGLLLGKEGVKLPDWVSSVAKKQKGIRNPDKLRKNRPVEEAAAEPATELVATVEEPEVSAEAAPAAEPETAETPAE